MANSVRLLSSALLSRILSSPESKMQILISFSFAVFFHISLSFTCSHMLEITHNEQLLLLLSKPYFRSRTSLYFDYLGPEVQFGKVDSTFVFQDHNKNSSIGKSNLTPVWGYIETIWIFHEKVSDTFVL